MSVNIYYANAHSIRGDEKRGTFLAKTSSPQICSYEIIALSAINLHDQITNAEVVSDRYNTFRTDRSHLNNNKENYGGTMIMVGKRFNCMKLKIDESIETTAIKMDTDYGSV